MSGITSTQIKRLAAECGFELAGIASAEPSPDHERYFHWVERGMAGAMSYLTDRRAQVRADPKLLLPTARSIVCVGKLYNTPQPLSLEFEDAERGWISRYAWGGDYHRVLRDGLERLRQRMADFGVFDSKICVDTAPLLERSYARQAGLGWIGKNTCLINQQMGSWFFLGELLTSLELEPDTPPPDRCGTCRRCIDACPTEAIVPSEDGWSLDSRLCISYFTIELRGPIPEEHRGRMGSHIFGCDICQDVCPWNRRAPVTDEKEFAPAHFAPSLEALTQLPAEDFHLQFERSPVERARHSGVLRSAAVAMGNTGLPKFREPLARLAAGEDQQVAEHARWALRRIG